MHYPIVIAALLSTALAARHAIKRQDQGVATAIVQWANDINTVNDFLQGGGTDAQTALTAAQDEPNQLGVLSNVNGLSFAGLSASSRLAANFPSIPNNLENLIGGADDLTNVVTAITYDRCCTVLPSIATLFQESANAVGEQLTTFVNLPFQCGEFQCIAF